MGGPRAAHPPSGQDAARTIAAVGKRRIDPVARTVLTFVSLLAITLVLVGVAGVVVLRRVATDQSYENASQLNALSAHIVQRRIQNGLVTGDADATIKVAKLVADAVITGPVNGPVVHVKIWGPDGSIVYADDASLIGKSFPTGGQILKQLALGQTLTRPSDPNAPENRGESGSAGLLDSYTRIQTPNKTPLLFETSQRLSSVADSQQKLLEAVTPVLVVALIAFALLLVPVAWILARRIDRVSEERAVLLQRAIYASDQERRRVAGDLHDGPVQELAGLAMRLSAQAERASSPAESASFRETAEAVRGSVRTLRSAIVGIYPPNLQTAGLGPALSDLTARLPAEGLDVQLEVNDPAGYGPNVDALLFRACQEGLRNVEAHAAAQHVTVRVGREGSLAVVSVLDDGRGVTEGDGERARQAGHFGLEILRDVIRDNGGDLRLSAREEGGTELRVEVPVT
jgi:two-component system, NarL family, sensor kinase